MTGLICQPARLVKGDAKGKKDVNGGKGKQRKLKINPVRSHLTRITYGLNQDEVSVTTSSYLPTSSSLFIDKSFALYGARHRAHPAIQVVFT